VIAIADLSLLLEATLGLAEELGVSTAESGVHGGEWETSLMLALRPDLVDMEKAVPGYTGDMETGVPRFFEQGARAVSETGVIGDPTRASAENGRRYFERLLELIVAEVERTSSRL
jgi:creatinine amidohydrolase/Fe(II)-dependent formamide hydrolase-like protein